MSQNYMRACSIQINALGKTYDANGIRVRFDVHKGVTGMPNVATIKLTNQNRQLAQSLCQPGVEFTPVMISAGYEGNQGILFKGNIVKCIYGRENPTDTLTQILCADGQQAYTYAIVNKTFPPGSTPRDHVNAAVAAFAEYGLTLGFIGASVALGLPVYPRSVTLFGQAHKVLDDVAKTKSATWSIQEGKVQIAGVNDSILGSAFELNSETGLIGMPTMTTGGLFARVLINPQLMGVNKLVHIDQSLIQGLLPEVGAGGVATAGTTPNARGNLTFPNIAADGIYKIVKIDVEADTRGQPWYMDLLCIIPGQSSSTSIYYDPASPKPSSN